MPAYRLHKASGKAVVTLSGRDVYLGEHNSDTSHAEYRVLAEWLATGGSSRAIPANVDAHGQPAPGAILVVQLLLAFWRHAEVTYPQSTITGFQKSLRRLRTLYGHTLVADFKPLSLRTIQQQMIDAKEKDASPTYCRRTINHYCADRGAA